MKSRFKYLNTKSANTAFRPIPFIPRVVNSRRPVSLCLSIIPMHHPRTFVFVFIALIAQPLLAAIFPRQGTVTSTPSTASASNAGMDIIPSLILAIRS
jgi:hypothetical protein